MTKIEEYLQVNEAAQLLGVSAATLRNWGRQEKLAFHRHPINHYRLYKQEDLEALLNTIRDSKSAPSKGT